ncbi:hypothetical protein ACW9I8_06150 [Pseudomonas reactans]|jgi:hypothetical protein|uniref:HEPN domain-containing protein n=3 Tax=Pseudomonas TaxID=286 RepID=A0A7Y7ZPH8_9PSED|nr:MULTISPECIES: hypothetical protein [Pseudomonas]ASV34909.1 hypothetical protein CI807_01495 [Pseudomonas sp. NS1(2017)]KGE65824.1 hypothetical protein K814_0121840 [Pseudomonas fluorescens LMG 5329]NWA45739.1 hypothetical protein [Pseudomonas reactans]NWB30190.1 hypothetical protein [Pseudomonas gingeri]NWC36664.1 hypothetical protein [Pseudomonas gingeri]
MTKTIDKEFVRQRDDELITQGLKLHQRPFHVVVAWMKANSISGDVFDKAMWDPLMAIYHTLYPAGDFSMPAMLKGSVALRDQMYPVLIAIGYGSVSVDLLDCIEIPHDELEFIFQQYPEQGWRAFYGVADLWDFAYGVSDLEHGTGDAPQLLANARSSLAATARILAGDIDIDAAVQTICLTAELALKGALAARGWTEAQYRKLSHHLVKLADALIGEVSTAHDDRLRGAIAHFPDYVGTRYASHGMTRIELMVLAMRAQFVAAETLRRVSDRDLASKLEADPNNLPRPVLWC